MTWIITSDTHLTDRPKDRYRFGLFDWLAKQQQKYDTTATFILGDITDRKDNHSALLVNKTVKSLLKLRPPIYILKGNHDFIDPANPFFEFLNWVEGIKFVGEPSMDVDLGVAFLPHQQDQASFDRACGVIKPGGNVMLHATIQGAIAETGAVLPGLRASAIGLAKPGAVWAGDIHRPQQCPWGAYVGAPFQVRFGDDFQPRVVLVKDGVERNLYYPCLHKWALRITDADQLLKNVNLHPKDQVKITIALPPEEVVSWNKHKQRVLGACKELGLEVFGLTLEITGTKPSNRVRHNPEGAVSPKQVFDSYCEAEQLPANIRGAGAEVLKG
jgi:hypothetical protein